MPRLSLAGRLAAVTLLAASPVARAAPLDVCAAARQPERDGRPATVFVQGRDGWIFRRDQDLVPEYAHPPAAGRQLRALQDALAAKGTTLVVALLPPRGLVHRSQVDPSAPGAEGFDPAAAGVDYAAHVAWLRAQGLQVVDPLAALEAVDGPAFFARDHHWRPEGAAAVAERIAAHVRGLPGGDTLPATAFDRKVTGTLPRRGALLQQVEALCGAQGVPDESSETSVRVARGGAVDAAALFGDAPAPEVVVVGDSNVNKGGMDAFDFAGALRSALGTEVLNVGVDGGGLYPPMQAFLASDAFQDQPPRFVVWVVGAHLRLADPNRLRQTVPLVGGDCSAAVARGSAALEKGSSTPALAVPPEATASGSWAVSVHPRDPAALRVRVHLGHDGGEPDRAVVVRSARVGVGEPALVALDPRRGPLRTVAVEPLLGASGDVDVALCPVR